MAYSPIQLDIIRTFGSKQLSEGCLVKIKGDNWIRVNDYAKIIANHIKSGAVFVLYSVTGKGIDEIKMNAWLYPEEDEYKTLEILGHIPHINDIFRMAKDKFADTDIHMGYLVFFSIDPMLTKDAEGIHIIPYNQSFDLLDQEESTLVQLLNLFK